MKREEIKTLWVMPRTGVKASTVVRPAKTFEFKGTGPYEIEETDYPLVSSLYKKVTPPKAETEKKEVKK